MKLIKKNQLTILVLALMLVTAGYLNYNSSVKETSTQIASIGDATLVSSNISNSISNQVKDENQNVNVSAENKSETAQSAVSTTEANVVETNATINKDDENEYFSASKLERDTMYSQMLDSYQKIFNNSNASEKQKEAAQEEIEKINKIKNSIMISENLIKTKGFDSVVIFVNDDSISVVVKKEKLKKEDIAQIQSIIAREMNAKIDDIHISNKWDAWNIILQWK